MNPESVIVCRCEDITLADLRRLIADGCRSLDELRRLARCGMGLCQGRNCRQLVLAELSRALEQDIRELALCTWRPPASPVRLDMLADLGGDDQ